MCDYSLHGLPNRLAQEGEDLVAHRFPTGAIGLTAPAELERRATLAQTRCEKKSFWSMLKAALLPPNLPEVPAVCVPPGARLHLSEIPVCLQQELGLGSEEIATFTQTTAMPNTYHDAISFRNGRQVLLQVLREGQRVQVLSLGCSEPEEAPTMADRLNAEVPF
jgi:hypothetical protein